MTFGKSHTFTKGNAVVAKLHTFAPGPLKKLFKPPFSTSFTLLEEEVLVLWYNRYDEATATYPPASLDMFRIVDEHGCVFTISQYGGGGGTPPAFSVNNARVDVFPRRQKTFTVRAQSFPVTNIEWTVENPFVTNPPAWKPEGLPMTRRSGTVDFTLRKITGHFYETGHWFEPKFQIVDDGVDRTEWYKPKVTYVDVTGNRDDQGLCPFEPAWKLEVDFYRNYKAPFAEEAIWRARGISLPRSGEVVSLGQTGSIAGIGLHLIALCGPGGFSFSNGVCVASAEWAPEWRGESSNSSSSSDRVQIGFRHKEATLLVRIEGLKRSEDLLLRMQDDQGGAFGATFRGSADNYYRYQIKVPGGAGKVDIEAIRQKALRIEYLVEPPKPKAPPPGKT